LVGVLIMVGGGGEQEVGKTRVGHDTEVEADLQGKRHGSITWSIERGGLCKRLTQQRSDLTQKCVEGERKREMGDSIKVNLEGSNK